MHERPENGNISCHRSVCFAQSDLLPRELLHAIGKLTEGKWDQSGDGVDERDDDYEGVAHWLDEAAHRRRPDASSQRESGDELIRYLEDATKKTLGTREDIRLWLAEMSEAQAAAERETARRRRTRETVLLATLAVAYLQYFYWDVNLQIAAMRPNIVFAAVDPAHRR